MCKSIRLEEYMKKQAGFTLIELVMVIVILGILAASFAPKFLDVKSDAIAAAESAALGATKSALTVYLAKNQGTYPSLTNLEATIDGAAGVAADNTGIEFDTGDTTNYKVATFTDDACSAATAAAANEVRCVQ